MGKTKRGKGTKLMAVADLLVFLSPSTRRLLRPHEVTLVETLSASFTREQPERLIGDKAYDSDPLDAELAERGSS